MIDLFFTYFKILANYSFLYIFLFFQGRAFLLVLNRLLIKEKKLPTKILEIKASILYPIIGIVYVGNILVITNFFIKLNSGVSYSVIFLTLLPNFLDTTKKGIEISLNQFIYYLFIPAVLLVSSSDINFHYDAGYYHLNHQNWLRESNIILGMTNIFWPFGISSIYEYLSAMLWTSKSLVNIHYLSVVFIHFLYSFLFFNLFESKNLKFRNASLLLIIFSILDNFGYSGGRNGFIYIQEVAKQDISLSILIIFLSLVILYQLSKKKIKEIDITLIPLFSLFILQIKVSGVIIFYLTFLFILYLLFNKITSLNRILLLNVPSIFLGLVWLLKNYLISGCFIYPLSITCINSFAWFSKSDVIKVENYTTETSYSFMQYFLSENLKFNDWIFDFFNSFGVFSEYYKSFYTNFFISFLLICTLALLIFQVDKNSKFILFSIFSYLLTYTTYIIFYGPIPRYSIGLLSIFIMTVTFFIKEPRVQFPLMLKLGAFTLSLVLLPRINSYINLYENKNISLYYPVEEIQEITNLSKILWHKPSDGDQCWIDISCRNEDGGLTFKETFIFKTANKIDI